MAPAEARVLVDANERGGATHRAGLQHAVEVGQPLGPVAQARQGCARQCVEGAGAVDAVVARQSVGTPVAVQAQGAAARAPGAAAASMSAAVFSCSKLRFNSSARSARWRRGRLATCAIKCLNLRGSTQPTNGDLV
jgi:hypothetical protein